MFPPRPRPPRPPRRARPGSGPCWSPSRSAPPGAVALGVYGRLHTPTGQAVNLAGFSSGLAVKPVLATVAMLLAVVQTVTAMAMFGRIPLRGAWVGPCTAGPAGSRSLVTVPVAVHCLYALGFQTYDTRTLLHSLFGCFFYGVFVVKMLVLTPRRLPSWALPLLGGLVFTGLTALWLTSSLWFFT